MYSTIQRRQEDVSIFNSGYYFKICSVKLSVIVNNYSEVDKLKKRDEKWHRVEELAKRNPNFTVSIDSMPFYTDFAKSPINDLDPTIDLKNFEEDTKYQIDTDVILLLLYYKHFNIY